MLRLRHSGLLRITFWCRRVFRRGIGGAAGATRLLERSANFLRIFLGCQPLKRASAVLLDVRVSARFLCKAVEAGVCGGKGQKKGLLFRLAHWAADGWGLRLTAFCRLGI